LLAVRVRVGDDVRNPTFTCRTNMAGVMLVGVLQRTGGDRVGAYEDVFRSSTADSEAFWLGAADAIDWFVAPTAALDASRPPFYRWFPDGELNVCHNALDRHVDAGRGAEAALIYDSPITDTQRMYT
jgi:Acetyl-coenzyme A synthetase N-terminus